MTKKLTKKSKEVGLGDASFINLCKKHIMVSNLDSVRQTTWLNNKDCNLFLIGELHEKHTKCKSIVEMLNEFVKDIDAKVNIDLMLDFLQKDVKWEYIQNGNDEVQLNNVRSIALKCIQKKNCKLRVHWTDPTETYYHDTSKNIEPWLIEISHYGYMDWSDNWSKNPIITKHFRVEADIPKLLTENRKVVKEIELASKVNPLFTLELATHLFIQRYKQLKKVYKIYSDYSWKKLVGIMTRHVMDFYTIARIIKLEMKNVIFYGGNFHTDNIIAILSTLNFKTIEVIKGQC